MTRVDTEIRRHLGAWEGFMCRPYSAHSPFAHFRQFAVLVVAWTLADLAGRTSPGVEQVSAALSFRKGGGAR